MKKITLFLAVVLFSQLAQRALGQMTIDPDFNETTLTNGGLINKILILPDDSFYVAGLFSQYDGTAINSFTKANADGTIDVAFNTGGSGTNSPTNFYRVIDTAVDADGKVLVVGGFNSFNGAFKKGVIRLNTNGTIDNSFVIDPEFDGQDFAYLIRSVKVDADGKILIAGTFTYNLPDAVTIKSFVRLNSNGSLDTTFLGNGNYGNATTLIELDAEGKILLSAANGLTRLNANGSVDTGFTSTLSGTINVIFSQADGSVFVGGVLTFLGQETAVGLVKLNNDGSVDTAFNTNAAMIGMAAGTVRDIKLYNGKLLVSGRFDSYGETDSNAMVLLNTDGSVDGSFSIGSGFTTGNAAAEVVSTAITSDNKILVAGSFTQFNGDMAKQLIRLEGTELGLRNFEENKVVVFNREGINFQSNINIQSIDIFDLTGRNVISINDINSVNYTAVIKESNQFLVARIQFLNGSSSTIKIYN